VGLTSHLYDALARKARGTEGPLIPLHVGDTWLEPPEAARAEAQRTADHPHMHTYAHPHGERALVDAIRARLNERSPVERSRGEIQVVSGGTAGLSALCQTLLDPGEELILPSPFWPLIRGMALSRGAVPVEVPFYTEEDPDVEGILGPAITEKTAAIYVNSPNNPTGKILGDRQAAAIARLARKHDLWIWCDEAYEDLWFGDTPPDPLWARDDFRERAIAVHTFSKAYGMAGARVGYIHGPAEVVGRVRAVFTHQVYCAPRPMQFAALAALEHGGMWQEEARRLYAEAARKTAEALGQPVPASGTFLFFDMAPWLGEGWLGEGGDVMPLLEKCVEAGVLLIPGAISGGDYSTWCRLCYTSVEPDRLADALERLRSVLGT
jgi:N-succinyldiaminopimelate aminotransferase